MPRERDMRPAVDAWLEGQGMVPLHEIFFVGYVDVVGVRFALRTSRLIPPMERIVAVELKLSDVAGVIRQAQWNYSRSTASYAAMPAGRIAKMRGATFDKFRAAGAGLLSVDGPTVKIALQPCIMNTRWTDYRRLHKHLWRYVRTPWQKKGK